MKRALVLLIAATLGATAAPAQSNEQRRAALMRYQVGVQHLAREAWRDAEREFQAAIELNRQMGVAHYGLGQAYMGMRDFARAIKAFGGARDAFMAETTVRTVIEGDSKDMRDEAIREMRQQAERAERAQLAGGGGGGSALAMGAASRLREHARQLERTTHRRQEDALELGVPAFVYLALGSAYFRSGALADAEREYLTAVRVEPKFGEAHNNLAVLYFETERFDLAEKHLRLAEQGRFRVHPQLKKEIRERRRGTL